MSIVDRLLIPYDCYKVEPTRRYSMAPTDPPSNHVENKITKVMSHYKAHPEFVDLMTVNDISDDGFRRFLINDLHDSYTGNKVFSKTTQQFDESRAPSYTEMIKLISTFIKYTRG